VAFVSTVVQSKIAPAGEDVKLIAVEVDEQIACEVGFDVTVGIGLTVTVTSIGKPTHVPTLGVIV
jgi:hypothetical protein